MSRRPRVMSDPTLLAVIDALGAELRIGLWRTGSTGGPRLERTVSATTAGLAGALDGTGAGKTVVMLAPGQVRCRVCDLPNAAEGQLDLALRLQAESSQLGSMPAHRVVMSVLPAPGGAARSGVILEWPPQEPPPSIPAAVYAGRRVTFAADVSALAGMACVQGVKGPLLVIDRERGMISAALQTPKGLALRSAREELGDGAVDAVFRLLAETALHQGVPASSLEQLLTQVREAFDSAGGAGFGCTASDRQLLAQATGAPIDPQWWRSNGLQAGIALLASGPLAPLAGLLAHEPGEEPDAVGRFFNRLAEPRVLTGVLAVAILAVVFGPVVISFLDYQLMRWKVRSVGAEDLRGIVADNDKLIAIYRERSTRTWPMTKLLADLACCTPEGIEFEQVTITHDESVSIRGKARRTESLSGPDVVLQMERLMQQSGIFDRITKGWDPPNQLGEAQFTLSASVTRPTQPMALNDETDWGKLTLAERKWGPQARPDASNRSSMRATPQALPGSDAATESAGASEGTGEGSSVMASASLPRGVSASRLPGSADASTATPAVQDADPTGAVAAPVDGETAEEAADAARRGGGTARRANERNLATSTPGNERTPTRAGPAAIEPDRPPDPLTDDQIASMTKEEALALASVVAKARGNKSFDDATRERLKEEFRKLMAHVQSRSG